jgi:6-phosphofructokinase 1
MNGQSDSMSIMEKVLADPRSYRCEVDDLGPCTVDSPLVGREFVSDGSRALLTTDERRLHEYAEKGIAPPAFERAGARRKLFFSPAWTRAAIVTAGGLCPGLNDVIKGIVQILHYEYGVRTILGLRYGFRGLLPEYGLAPMVLTPEIVDTIHEDGGTILGSSRGNGERTVEMVDTLQRERVNMLFCVGGDGTLRGASDVADEIRRRDLPISVIGIPKTVDNDLNFVGRTFGFETAVYQTHAIITAAHMEAKGAHNGIGLIKLMGRDSGFIAAYASLANSVVNVCLVPECEFDLAGPDGLLSAIERRLSHGKTHCVIVVAEGAGQHLIESLGAAQDASGNAQKKDIGEYLKCTITDHFKRIGRDATVKYFDPSYSIRSAPAQGTDAILCHLLAKNAVHAAMAGKTNCVVGHLHDVYTLVPIPLATQERQKLGLRSELWRAVLDATRQNDYFRAVAVDA